MATILVVDDRPVNRQFLITLLGYYEHRLLEAGDGAEALEVIRAEHPDLVIADILMPTMDGYELVREVRADGPIAHTKIIFFTATYREREARALAAACGIRYVLTKPAEPEVVISTVSKVLEENVPAMKGTDEKLLAEDLGLLTDALRKTLTETERVSTRLAALVELNLDMTSETDIGKLLESFCRASRDIIVCQHSAIGILDEEKRNVKYHFLNGYYKQAIMQFPSPSPLCGIHEKLLNSRKPVRLQNPDGNPSILGLCADHPPVYSLLGVPIVSKDEVYGWLRLSNKLGDLEFSMEDERLAITLAAQIAVCYENAALYSRLQEHAKKLEIEVERRRLALEALSTVSSAVEQSDDCVVITNSDGMIEYVNPAFEKLTGYRKEEAVGKTPRIVKSGKYDQEFYAHLWRKILNGEVFRFQFENKKKNGELYHEEQTITPVRNPNGEITHFVSTAKDVTQSKLAAQELEKATKRLTYLFETLDEVFFSNEMLPQQKILYISPACYKVYGYPEEAFYKDPLLYKRVVHPEDSSIIERNEDLLRAGKSISTEHRIVRPDGQIRWVEASVKPTLDESGTVLRADGLVYDITERKRAELALRESEQSYSALAAFLPVGVFRTDREGLLVYGNRAWCEMVGKNLEDALSSHWTDFVDRDDRQHVVSEWERSSKTTSPFELEYRLQSADRPVIWVIGRAVPEKNLSGEVVGYIGSLTDITDRKRAEEERGALEKQLLQSQKMEAIGQLAGGVAHDFNNTLMAIESYCELLPLRLPENDMVRSVVHEMQKTTHRGAKLTRQLLTFSKKQVLTPEILSMNKLITNIEDMLRRLIGENIELISVLPDDLGNVKADPGQVEQVLMNLAVNARDAMPQGGKLIIETSTVSLDEEYVRSCVDVTPGEYVMLSVSDTGYGMDTGTISHIFEPFFTTKEEGKGTGLGLSTVYGIVKQSGGHISVYSQPGKGTTFKIYLPRIDEPLQTSEKLAGCQNCDGRGERILLVDDNDSLRAAVAAFLEIKGYTVLQANDAQFALELMKHQSDPIHLLISDVVMPGMSGRELGQCLTANYPHLKIIYMSGYTEQAVTSHGLLDNGTLFISKPASMNSLLLKIRELLDSSIV